MQLFRIVSFLFVFAMGLVAYASPAVINKRQSDPGYADALNTALTTIQGLQAQLEANTTTLSDALPQIVTAINDARSAVVLLPPILPSDLSKRDLVDDISEILAAVVTAVGTIVGDDILPALTALVTEVDVALNDLVLTLDGLIAGLATLITALLSGVADLLQGLGLLLAGLGL